MDLNLFLDYTCRFAASFVCGFLIGLERKSRQHIVGVRTLVLISTSSTLLTILSVYMAEHGIVTGDPTRIAAGVVTGIGFLGGGAILRQGLNIRGLTTATIMFTACALGLACGAGLYIPVAITMLIIIVVLYALSRLERRIFPAAKTKKLNLRLEGTDFNQAKLKEIMANNGLIVNDINIEYTAKENQTKLSFTVKTPDDLDTLKLSLELYEIEKLINFSLNDMT